MISDLYLLVLINLSLSALFYEALKFFNSNSERSKETYWKYRAYQAYSLTPSVWFTLFQVEQLELIETKLFAYFYIFAVLILTAVIELMRESIKYGN